MNNTDIFRVSREYKKEDTVISVGGFSAGSGNFSFIAGPCAVESYETAVEIAKKVKEAGAGMLRAGAFKPRTSPYTFQGMGREGLDILAAAGKEAGLPTVSEITDPRQLPLFESIDMLQVGTRNMQNYELLKELGGIDKPVLLKRGMGATLEEFLLSAEYILAGGNEKVILCERGIRTFGDDLRNTLDVGAISLLKSKTHLPIIADPSHAAGIACAVPSLTFAAAAAGADGIMLEVHTNPGSSVSDPEQALTPEAFSAVVKKTLEIREIIK